MAHHIIHRAAVAGGGSPDFNGLTRVEFTVESLTQLQSGDAVSSWVDSGPSGHTLTQTGTARPTHRGNRVEFDGIDDEMENAGALAIDTSGGLTMFLAFSNRGVSAFDGPFSGRKTGAAITAIAWGSYYVSATDWRASILSPSSTQWYVIDLGTLTAGLIYSARFSDLDPADDPVYKNRVSAGTPTELNTMFAPTDLTDTINIGRSYSPFFEGDVYSVAFYYGRTMTNAEVEQVHASLNARFGLY